MVAFLIAMKEVPVAGWTQSVLGSLAGKSVAPFQKTFSPGCEIPILICGFTCAASSATFWAAVSVITLDDRGKHFF